MLARWLTILIVFLLLATGCAPKPDKSLILWEQPSPEMAANLHASIIDGKVLRVADTGSMEPFLTGGDFIVADTKFKFHDLKPGDLVLYQASWQADRAPWVCHMLAAWYVGHSRAVMSGIANPKYENGGYSLEEKDYRAKVVQVYSKRVKK